jgi:hypothetical protein
MASSNNKLAGNYTKESKAKDDELSGNSAPKLGY